MRIVNRSVLKIFILIFLYNISFAYAESKFNVEVNEFKPSIEKDEWVEWKTLRLKKIGRNQLVVTGDIAVKRNGGEEQQVAAQIYTYKNKRRGPLLFSIKMPLCQFLKESKMYADFRAASNLPEGKCPFPKGEYTINNYEVDLDFLPPKMPKGDYLIYAALLDKAVSVADFEADFTLT